VLEVDTPVLARTAATDPAIASLGVHVAGEHRYLQTSPEFLMKRLLAAGTGAIFQLGPAFRGEEHGRLHNPEFTLLEWYRPGFDDHRLMDEVAELIAPELGLRAQPARISFTALFEAGAGVDPHEADAAALRAALTRMLADGDAGRLSSGLREADRDTLIEVLYAVLVERRREPALFVHDFPASHAALARTRTDADGRSVAARFELVVAGVEVANGYHELTSPDEQRARFEAERARRRAAGLEVPPLDERLLAALAHGLPDCAGVALGVDRLLMLALGERSLDAVRPFSFPRA